MLKKFMIHVKWQIIMTSLTINPWTLYVHEFVYGEILHVKRLLHSSYCKIYSLILYKYKIGRKKKQIVEKNTGKLVY